MTFFKVPITIPSSLEKQYHISRMILYFVILIMTLLFISSMLFPTITKRFDFRTPDSSRNTLLSPRSEERTPRTNGKVEKRGILLADTAVIGTFSTGVVKVALEKDLPMPETMLASIRRSYQSFFLETGETVTAFPVETTYRVGDTYYALREGQLFPYVSDGAYLSRFEANQAQDANDELLLRYPVREEWIGYRAGALLGNATGVFIVTSESEARPVGSAEIFLALGYTFDDVITVSEEELGIYKRGRIIELGATHPDGTLLLDQDTNAYFLVEGTTKRLFLPGAYRDFLLKKMHPIVVSSAEREKREICTLAPSVIGSTLSCKLALTPLTALYGNDFELRLTEAESAIDIRTISVSFETAKSKENMLTLFSKVKQRMVARFGGGA